MVGLRLFLGWYLTENKNEPTARKRGASCRMRWAEIISRDINENLFLSND